MFGSLRTQRNRWFENPSADALEREHGIWFAWQALWTLHPGATASLMNPTALRVLSLRPCRSVKSVWLAAFPMLRPEIPTCSN